MTRVPAAIFCACIVAIAPLRAWQEAPPSAGALAFSPARFDEAVVRALRDSRRKDGPSHDNVVATIVERGPTALEFLIDLLVERKVPALVADEPLQVLSVPQREMLLDALSRASPAQVIDAVETRVRDVPDASLDPEGALRRRDAIRAAALYAYASVGGPRHLPRVFELALLPDETQPQDALSAALQCATERILRRDPSGFDWLRGQMERARKELGSDIVFAIGATRDPRGLPLFTDLLSFHPELAAIVLSQARLLGRSIELDVNRSFAVRVAPYLESERSDVAAAAARIVGELGHDEVAPRLIELLASTSVTVRESALWGLQHLSHLDYPAQARLWQRWFDAENAFWSAEAPKLLEELERGNRTRKLAALAELSGRTLHRDDYALAIAGQLCRGDADFSKQACTALTGLRSLAPVPRLVDALDDRDAAVAAAAHSALEALLGRPLPAERERARAELRL